MISSKHKPANAKGQMGYRAPTVILSQQQPTEPSIPELREKLKLLEAEQNHYIYYSAEENLSKEWQLINAKIGQLAKLQQKMVQDHQVANTKISEIAQQHQRTIDQLRILEAREREKQRQIAEARDTRSGIVRKPKAPTESSAEKIVTNALAALTDEQKNNLLKSGISEEMLVQMLKGKK